MALPFLVSLGSEIQDSGVSLGECYRELFSGLLVTAGHFFMPEVLPAPRKAAAA